MRTQFNNEDLTLRRPHAFEALIVLGREALVVLGREADHRIPFKKDANKG